MKYTIVIDPGHGGHDPGAPRRDSGPPAIPFLSEKTFEPIIEKEVVRKIGLYARRYLNDHYPDKFMVHITRRDDTFLTLQQRCNKAIDLNADLFISVHCNAFDEVDDTGPGVTGIETFYYWEDAKRFANILQGTVMETLMNHRDRGVKYGNFKVIRESVPEAVLLECEFIDEEIPARLLDKENTQRQYGVFIGESVREYFLT